MKVYFEKGLTVINTGDPVGGCKNKNGCNGISYRKEANKYRASIQFKKKKYHLGDFDDIELAVAYYQEAKQQVDNNTFLEWHQTLYGKTKRKQPRSETK